jgi:hypothetical protein
MPELLIRNLAMNLSALVVALVASIAAADDAWKPPENPDPHTILQEAHADTRAMRYEQALAKHVWYHENALRIQPAQQGVRLSFALSYWKELADVDAPAFVKLVEVREEAVKNALEGANARQSFQDLAAISKTLGEDARTTEVFVELDKKQPEIAKQVYSLAQPALIKAKEYQLCNKYLEPEQSLRLATASFESGKKLAENPKFGAQHLDFVHKSFTNKATTLVALLTVNGRLAEADKAAKGAMAAWDDAHFQGAIGDALAGKVPAPWP